MRKRVDLSFSCAFVAAFVLTACGPDPGTRSQLRELVVTQVDTLVSTASELLAHPTDIAIGSDGTVYIADARSNRVLALSREGRLNKTIGREGQGPGEFSRPSAVAQGDSGIVVFDAGNGRVESFSLDGQFRDSYAVPPEALAGSISIRGDGTILVSSMGADSSLALKLGPSGEPQTHYGLPVVEQPTMFDFASMKAQIADGVVPDEFRNNVLVVQDDDGSVWIALQTEAELRRYDAEGRRLWQVVLDDPQLQRAKEDFFNRNAETDNPAVVVPLRQFADLAVGQGQLWILLAGSDDDPAIVLTFDRSGSETRRIKIPAARGVGSISYDPTLGRLLLGTIPDAQLVSAEIPLGAVPASNKR